MSVPLLIVDCILLVLSVVSFIPQISRIQKRGNCDDISSFYFLFSLIVATHHFIISLEYVVIDGSTADRREYQPNKPSDWLNFAQFLVVGLLQFLLILYLLTLPPNRPNEKKKAIAIYTAYLLVALVPAIAIAAIPEKERIYYTAYIQALLTMVNPVITILCVVAFYYQASALPVDSSSTALSFIGLCVQAVVFLLVGISFLFRMTMPDEYWRHMRLVYVLQRWYLAVGYAAVNNIIYAIGQAGLAWIMWRHRGSARTSARETEPLLSHSQQ